MVASAHGKSSLILLEQLVVAIIIAITASMVLPGFVDYKHRAEWTMLAYDAKLVESAIYGYYLEQGEWPIDYDNPLNQSHLPKTIYTTDLKEISPINNATYYEIDMSALTEYVPVNSCEGTFVLDNTSGNIYITSLGKGVD